MTPDLVAALSALEQVLLGDPSALPLIAAVQHADLLEAAAKSTPLLLTGDAVAAVLTGILIGSITDEQAQRWASFVRLGFVPDGSSGPISPLDIIYEQSSEDAIVEAVARLDELGDAVDGVLTTDEIKVLGDAINN